MARSAEALVKAALLVWGRKSAHLDENAAAKRIGVPFAVLQAWESGEARPTFVQLRKIADVYKRPLAVFYLAEPPRTFDAMRYFRQLPDVPPPEVSPELVFQLRQAESRREVVLDLAGEVGIEAKPFGLRATIEDAPQEVARRARIYVGLDVERQRRWRSADEAYRGWREALEAAQVLVFQLTKIPVEAARGFSIAEDRFPVIAVNGKDAVNGRIFSLFHELAHLILRQGESLDASAVAPLATSKDRIEVFCNEFAGAFLVPSDVLDAETVVRSGERRDDLEPGEALRLAREFSVSQEVILRRFLSTKRITEKLYSELRATFQKRGAEVRSKPSKAIVPPYRNAIAQLGRPYIRTVLGAYHQDRITLSAASEYLGLKTRHFPKLEATVFTGGGE
jgi:Zn-dependent peptidase ImmA (M78 family)